MRAFPGACLLVVLSVPWPAAAEDSMESILVIGSRTPVPVAEFGGSATIIDETQLEARQVFTVSDILRNVPGVAVSRGGPPGSLTQLRMRGAEANHVLVLIDGIEANDPAQGSEFNFAHLLAADIERLEVVRGPQSALWGSDAVGGVISIRTRRAGGAPAASGFLEGGSFDTVHGGASLEGSSGTAQLRLSGSVLDAAGTNLAREGGERDGYRNARFSAAGGWDPRGPLAFDLIARHVEGHNEFDNVDFATGLPADSDDRSEFTQDYGLLRARLEPGGGRWRHELSGAVTSTENDNFTGGVAVEGTEGRKYRLAWQSTLTVNSGGRWPAGHALTAAAEYEAEDFTQRGPVTPFGDPNQDRDITSSGWIGEYRLAFADGPALAGSLRHDDNSDFGDSTTWRLSAAWPIESTGTRLRGSYGIGVKNPTFTDRFGFFSESAIPFVGNPALKPERSTGWEAGFDQQLGPVRVSFTWFRERLRDEINGLVFDPALGAFTAINVPGRSRREGVEAELGAALGERLHLSAAYTLLNAWEPGPAGDVRELRRPRHSGSVSLDYRFHERGSLNVNVNYVGRQEDLFFPPFPAPSQRVALHSYTLVTVAGSWALTPAATVSLRVENVLDEDYEEVFGFSQPGIAAFAGLRLRFSP